MEKKIDSSSVSSLLVDVGKYLVLTLLLIVFGTIVADVFAYGYALHFLDPSIVLAYAKPSTTILAVSALWVILVNAALEFTPSLRPIAIVRRTYNEGFLCAFGSSTPRAMIVALVSIYVVAPAILGQAVALSQTSFRVMKLDSPQTVSAPAAIPRRVLNEAIIVGRTDRGGVLLALFDRVRKAVVSNVEIVDNFGPSDPKLYEIETLGAIRRVRKE